MSIQAGILPELQIGVETPWPLKREGKQVYAKRFDLYQPGQSQPISGHCGWAGCFRWRLYLNV